MGLNGSPAHTKTKLVAGLNLYTWQGSQLVDQTKVDIGLTFKPRFEERRSAALPRFSDFPEIGPSRERILWLLSHPKSWSRTEICKGPGFTTGPVDPDQLSFNSFCSGASPLDQHCTLQLSQLQLTLWRQQLRAPSYIEYRS